MAAPTDTIAAIATPAGAGGIGIVRVSGPAADAIGVQLLGRAPSPRQAHYCGFRDAAGELIDSGLLLAFPAPHSYTGEDVLELQAHGSPVLLNLLLARCYQLGARPARPGEFSERAYLNGKLDLAQAEAVADLIAAGSEAAARAAQRSLSGEFSRLVESLAQQLIELRVYVEAAIDFPEEEIDFLRSAELRTRFARLQQQLDDLLSASRRGQRLRDGLHAVIVGAPNVGKSSLLNALSGEDRAIVSAVPGTTRDLLREQILVGGLALTVVDTAGLRASADPIEREGIARAGREARRADLLIWVHESGDLEPSELALDPDWPADLPQLHVHNKIDLRQQKPKLEQCGNAIHVHLSARSGDGLDLLRQALLQHAGLAEGGGDFSARARHVDALQRCQLHTATAHDMALEQGIGELAAEELRRAHDNLGEITGRMRSDELLGAIFSSFCIGK